jgi:nitrile hydratase accessory protein
MIKKLDYKLPHLSKNQDDIVFKSPWHSQLFAMTIQLSEQGNFKWVEFVEVFGEALNNKRLKLISLDGNDDYFNCWLTALEKIIILKKIADIDVLSLLKDDWTKAYLSTPHGKPVKINSRSV